MWSFVPNNNSRRRGSSSTKSTMANLDCSDDEVSSCTSKEEGFECPICWESFNIVENVPYVLWCGHTLCKTCILGLKWAIVKFPNTPIQLPFMISCPWCNFLSLRFMYKGNLAFPRKNYFLLWMVERMNGDRRTSTIINHAEHDSLLQSAGNLARSSHGSYHQSVQRTQSPIGENTLHRQTSSGSSSGNYINVQTIHSALRKALDLFIRVTAKFPLVIVFLLIVVYVIPASAVILVVFIIITILFALPSFLMIYFAYPVLDWLVREILAWYLHQGCVLGIWFSSDVLVCTTQYLMCY